MKRGRTTWVNIEHARPVDIRAIAQELKLSEEHMHLIQASSHRSRLFVAPNYVLLLITHPVYDEVNDDVVLHEIDVVLTASKIVTIHHGHMTDVTNLFDAIQVTRTHPAAKHPATILAHILTSLTMDVYGMVETLGQRVDHIEERIYQKDPGLLRKIVNAQTNIIDVQKTLESRASMLERLLDTVKPTARRHLAASYDQLMHHTKEIHDNLKIEYRTAETLHRAHETYLNGRTNRLINILTIVSIVILPATLLAGIFGMNTRNPWILGSPYDFGTIVAIMALGALILWFLIRRVR